MNNKKATKRALLTSVMALVMCVVMLVGTTFAWFTDTASTGVNKIQAGNLDIEVEYRTTAGGDWKTLDNATDLFGAADTRFEPGHTRVVELKIKNAGNLALKYKIGMNVVSETAGTNKAGNPYKLSNYLKVATSPIQQYDPNAVPGSINYAMEQQIFAKPSFLAWEDRDFANFELDKNENNHVLDVQPGAAQILGIKVYMPESVGNEANAISTEKAASIEFGLNILATQYTVERDSFGTQYDKDATYPTLTTGKTLNDVFGGANFDFGSTNPSANVVLDGQGLVTVSDYVDGWFAGDVTIKGVTFLNGVCFTAKNDDTTGTITFEDCTFYACDQSKIDLTSYQYNSLKNSGDGLCLNVDTKNSPNLKVVVKDCTFIGEDDVTLNRDGWKDIGGENWNAATAVKNKSRGHAIMINGICGGGNNAQAESVLIDGCTMSGIRGHAIQLYQLRMPVTIKDCKINSWGRNAQTAAGSKEDAAIRGDIADATSGTLTLQNNYFGLNEKINNILHVKVNSFSSNTDGSRTAGTY
mgnify:CR=1 FL=1